MIYIGLDVHKVNTTVAWLDRETGEISGAHNCPTDQLRELERTRQRLTQQTTRLGSYSGLVPRVSQSGERCVGPDH